MARDLIYEFAVLASNTDLQFGWRMMHASFRYVGHHSSPHGFSTTVELEQKAIPAACPFYTACDLKLRINSPEICARTPWRSAAMPEADERACWYRAGVMATTAGAD